ncbi:MAG: hypothetical protein M5R38_18045 [Candidatus Methylomirabilis sp.]|nr:hypothetical protein [Candidatus Methylomirabilis sp.]
MLHEALSAAEILRKSKCDVKVVNMPWINRVDPDWLLTTIGTSHAIYVLEDHAPVGGLGDTLPQYTGGFRPDVRAALPEVRRRGIPGVGNTVRGAKTSWVGWRITRREDIEEQ